MSDGVVSVSEITRNIKRVIEQYVPYVAVSGEISNFKPHYSGHFYFTLKDYQAQLSVVMWRSKAEQVPIAMDDGLQIICHGQITVYERSGRYQLIADRVEAVGQGDLQARFEAMKQELFERGYFEESLKKAIPRFPERIGIITSPTGAAIRDMASIAARRNPSVELVLRPTAVQGASAAADIAMAIEAFNHTRSVDLIIIGRGGGSLEDLWAFNERIVADAVYYSTLPIVSAVGHEVDWTISDFVADMRAATPSAAIELTVPDRNELLALLADTQARVQFLLRQRISTAEQHLKAVSNHYLLHKPAEYVRQRGELLSQLRLQLKSALSDWSQRRQYVLDQHRQAVQNLNPEQVLKRGFSLVYQAETLISTAGNLSSGRTRIRFADGERNVEVTVDDE